MSDEIQEPNNVADFDVTELFEYTVKRQSGTTVGINFPTSIKTIVEVTSWYNDMVSKGYENNIFRALGPVGYYEGEIFEIKTRRGDSIQQILTSLTDELEAGNTLLILEVFSSVSIDPANFEVVYHNMIRYAPA